MEYVEEFDKLKTRVLKYILYKKRTEAEIRQKFSGENLLEELIEHLKQIKYISDSEYIKKAVNEFTRLKKLSVAEIKYKLQGKGLNKTDIENYIYENKDVLYEYERDSARNIILKKQKIMDMEEVKKYLMTKRYRTDIIEDVLNT